MHRRPNAGGLLPRAAGVRLWRYRPMRIVTALVLACGVRCLSGQTATGDSSPDASRIENEDAYGWKAVQAIDSGRQQFLARCASCHGEDGGGGARGSTIVKVDQPRASSRDAVRDLIRRGIPNVGMPAFPLSDEELDSIATYVLSLRAASAAKPPATGESTPPVHPMPAGMGVSIPFVDGAPRKPGTWPTYHGRLNGNRFSPLEKINTGNVQRLAAAWMFTIRSAPRDLQVTPVVAGGVMYVTSVNEAFALDARSGREMWHYSRPRTPGLAGDAASGINRGVALPRDRVFTVTDNAHLIALDRRTGQLLWDVEMADARQNYGATSAPLVVNDLVISCVSGGDEGIRGFLDAYRAATGERVWRFWTVPAPGEPGSETWGGRAIEHGCAATWLTGTYDPESRLLYWPTGNPCPDYNGAERHGDNLYSNSVLALDPDTGTLKWHYQFTPHDLHDWDATETPMLVDAEFRGQRRKLLLQGNRNGFFYVLDRLTGQVLLAEPFVKNITWASGIGPDGRPRLLPGNEPTVEGQRVCPAVAGATNWPSTAFSPVTSFFYLFADESCSIYTKNDEWWQVGKSFYGGGTRRAPGDTPAGAVIKALDIQTGRTAWETQVGGGILGSGRMVTTGRPGSYGDRPGRAVPADRTTRRPPRPLSSG